MRTRWVLWVRVPLPTVLLSSPPLPQPKPSEAPFPPHPCIHPTSPAADPRVPVTGRTPRVIENGHAGAPSARDPGWSMEVGIVAEQSTSTKLAGWLAGEVASRRARTPARCRESGGHYAARVEGSARAGRGGGASDRHRAPEGNGGGGGVPGPATGAAASAPARVPPGPSIARLGTLGGRPAQNGSSSSSRDRQPGPGATPSCCGTSLQRICCCFHHVE